MNQITLKQPVFNLSQAYKQAWTLVDGSKWPIWLVYLAYMGIGLAITALTVVVLFGGGMDVTNGEAIPDAGMQRGVAYMEMLMKIFLAPLGVGSFMVAILRARGQKPAPMAGFHYFNQWLNLSLTQLIVVLAQLFVRESTDLLRVVGEDNTYVFILYFLGFFLISFFTIFALPLVADKQLKPWTAIKTSIAIASKHWVQVLTLLLSVILVWAVLCLPVAINILWVIFILIAAVWLLPLSLLLFANLYHSLVDGQAARP